MTNKDKNKEIYKTAFQLAKKFHSKQKRYDGSPYFQHLENTANKVLSKTKDYSYATVAILHDIIEDTECVEKDLIDAGIPGDIIYDVFLLTHNRNTPREEYYKKIKASRRATLVKIADMADNIGDLGVSPVFDDPETRQRLARKYAKGIIALTE